MWVSCFIALITQRLRAHEEVPRLEKRNKKLITTMEKKHAGCSAHQIRPRPNVDLVYNELINICTCFVNEKVYLKSHNIQEL